MGPWIGILAFIPLLSRLHPTMGSFHGPLLVLDGLEDSGIRLKCLSERLFSEVQVLWMDGKGRNITGNPLSTDTAGNAGSSIVLTPGSGNAVSCRIVDSLGKTSRESSIVIAAFVMILLFGIFLVLAAVYKLRNIEDLKMELVPLTLDELCKHPELSLRDQSRVVSCSATAEQLHPKPVIVSKESFSQGKHYWEVEVGAGSGWELGVLAEEIRDSLQNGGMVLPREREQVLSLGYSRGEFNIPGGWNCRPCPVLGVFLDQESHNLSFFDVEGKSLLTSLPLRFSGNLFPFFSPGSNEKGLGIRSVGV
ncbi:butyrophilin subfamily 2 member A1-like isoform X7 [Pitangus sulphuratus]|nr:butyrophilin subfamily 2 member A1-like isoform X7 [Pitangus sulphuratus]